MRLALLKYNIIKTNNLTFIIQKNLKSKKKVKLQTNASLFILINYLISKNIIFL